MSSLISGLCSPSHSQMASLSTPILKRILFSPSKPKHLCLSSLSYTSSVYQTPSTDPIVSDVVSILTHQRSKSRWSTLFSLYPTGFNPSQFSEIAISIKNNPHLALCFYLFTCRRALCTHNLLSYSILIHILSRARLKSRAQSLMTLAFRAARALDADSSCCKTESQCVLKVFESLVKTYNRCGSAPFVFDLLVKSCLQSKKIMGSIEILRKLRSRGISPQSGTCNALIWEVSRSRGAFAGYEIYREVFGLDVEFERDVKWVVRVRPNVHTFNALMECFYREGEIEKVKEIWTEMEEWSCKPNVYSFSILMEAFCEEKNMKEVEKLWEEVRVRGLKHDVVAYNTMIGGFCRNGEMGRAEEFFREMGLNRIGNTSVTYEHLINGYCKVGNIDEAILKYKDMRMKYFRPEASTMDALIKGLCDEFMVLEALKTLKVAMVDFGFCPTRKSYELLIKGLCEEGKMDEALKLQAEMTGRGFETNLVIYSAFIDGYVKQENEEMATLLKDEMVEVIKAQKDSAM